MTTLHRLESLLRVYHHEQAVLCRRPSIAPCEIAAALGVTDRKTLYQISERAQRYVERCRMAATGGRTPRFVKPARFVVGNSIVLL